MILKLWRGQYGLAKTWWLFGVLGTLLLNLISAPLFAIFSASAFGGILGIALAFAVVMITVIGVCYGVVVSVAIVRSAMAFSGSPIWSWLTVALMAFGWIGAITYVVMT